MNKVVAFLEKYVQWIALGLGALYLGYMIFSYVVQTPVLVTGIAPMPLTPGEVDPHILDIANQLDAAMKNPNVPEMAVPNFIDKFKSDMSFTDWPSYALNIILDSKVLRIPVGPSRNTIIPEEAPVVALPVPPAAIMVDSVTGKSNIQPFAAAAPAAGNPAPGGNGAQPVAGSSDKSWVTVSFTISPSDIAKAFKAAHIPAYSERTSFLEVQLSREEAQAGGKWSDPKVISPINIGTLQAYPGNANDQPAYLTWAQAHVHDLLQPDFYTVIKGDPWRAPGQIVNVALNQPQKVTLDPTKDYPLNVLRGYSDDERKAYFQQKAKLKAPQRQNTGRRSSPNTVPPPPDGGPGQIRRNARPDGIGEEIDADVVPPAVGGNEPGAAGPDVAPQAPDAPAAPAAPDLATQFPLPAGDFDPNTIPANITGWAHDDTVEPGRTYRYMVTYRIKNPILNTNAAKQNPALNGVFDLQSPDGQWSKPINVASTTNFFVYANSQPGQNGARFKVYKWQDGLERSKVFVVTPGDIIGGKDGDVDYSTGWTLVDLRFDDPRNPGSMTLLVMDPTGIIDRRDYRTDQANPVLNTLNQAVSASVGTDQLAGAPK